MPYLLRDRTSLIEGLSLESTWCVLECLAPGGRPTHHGAVCYVDGLLVAFIHCRNSSSCLDDQAGDTVIQSASGEGKGYPDGGES